MLTFRMARGEISKTIELDVVRLNTPQPLRAFEGALWIAITGSLPTAVPSGQARTCRTNFSFCKRNFLLRRPRMNRSRFPGLFNALYWRDVAH